MNKDDYQLLFNVIFLFIGYLIGLFIGVYGTKENLEYKYQDITPTSTTIVNHDTYHFKLQEKNSD